ncbi:MAG: hypothetical protein WEA58_13730 [Balneolaceae bacterium]
MTSKEITNSNSTNTYSGFFWVLICLFTFTLTACSDDNPINIEDEDPEETIEISAEFSVSNDEPTVGEEVTLDAGESTISEAGSSLQYSWTLIAPDNSEAELENTDAEETSFTADIGGEYEITLEVTFDDLTDTEEKVIEALAYEELNSNITENRTLFSNTLYRVTSGFVVSAELTIEPGTVIEFEENTGIQFNENSIIIADGTEQDSIRFTGTEQNPGHWDGLQVSGTESPNNIMNYVVIEYGGNRGFWTSSEVFANLTVGGRISSENARLQLTNSTLRHSAGVGMRMTNESSLQDSENNTYTQNEEAAVYTEANLINYLDSNSDYTGNENDYVAVSAAPVTETDRVWNALNVPYRINGTVVVNDINLTIAAGAEFEFTNGSALDYTGDETFLVDGNENNPILFTGVEKEKGWWAGVWVNDAENPDNRMNYVVMEYGGGDSFWSTHSEYANLIIGGRTETSDARMQVTNSTFSNSGGYGLKISGDGSNMPDSENNTYTENESGAVYLSANNMHHLDSNSDYTGNSSDFVRVTSTDVLGSQITWNKLNVPYRLSGSTVVREVELTINPGVEIEFTSGADFDVTDESIIKAIGTEEDNIVFTGTEEAAGWWNGMLIQSPNPANEMDYVTFEYGGGDSFWTGQDENANLIIGGRIADYEGFLNITNSTLNHSEGVGVYVRDHSTANADICDSNSFSDNQEGNCLVE